MSIKIDPYRDYLDKEMTIMGVLCAFAVAAAALVIDRFAGSAAGPRRLTGGAKTMSAPQIIRSPSGEELVVLPRAEYEALLERADRGAEDADDVAIYDARKAELAAGDGVLPPEVSAAILRGDSRLKAIRKWRDETQLHLEFKTGIGQGYLSDLENGRRTGTPETIAKLAEALNVPVEWLS